MYRDFVRNPRLELLKILGLIGLVVMVMATCAKADRMAVNPEGEFIYLESDTAPGGVMDGGNQIPKGLIAQYEYLVVDWETVQDCPSGDCMPMYGPDGYSYPTHIEKVIKHFKSIDEVTEYLNIAHPEENYHPEVYQAIPVKMKCEVQEDTSWHLQKDVQKTYRWRKKQ